MFRKTQIKLPTRIIITGKTNTGKSIYGKTLLYFLADKIDKLYIISPTLEGLEDLTKESHIFPEYEQEALGKIVRKQKLREEKPQTLIYIDDSALDISKTDEILNRIFMNGRHDNLSVIIITQKFRCLSLILRDNTDYVCCTKIFNIKEKEALFEEYGGIEKKEFYKKLDDFTKNYYLMIINNTTPDEQNVYLKDRGKKELPEFYVERRE